MWPKQVNNLNHCKLSITLMVKGFDMKTHIFSATLTLVFAANSAPAATYYFEQNYSEGAKLSGFFEAVDLDGDNVLGSRFDEVQSFTGRFSGNSRVAAFTFTNLLGLLVDLNSTPILGDALPWVDEWLLASDAVTGATVLVSSQPSLPGCDPIACGLIASNTGSDSSTGNFVVEQQSNNGPIAPVPLPATGFLLFGALAGGLALLRRKS